MPKRFRGLQIGGDVIFDTVSDKGFPRLDWEKIFDEMPDAVAIMDEHHRFEWVNRAMAAFLGRPRGDIIGRTCHKLVLDSAKPPDFCLLQKLKATRRRETIEIEIPDRGLWIRVAGDPLFDGDGKVVGAIHYLSDITQAKRAQEMLSHDQEMAGRLLSLMNNIPGIVYRGLRDWSLSFIGFDVERITGYTSEEFINGRAKWRDLIHPDDLQHVKDLFREAVRRGDKILRVEYRAVHRDGTVRWLSDRRQLLYDDQENFAYVDGLLLDVTAQKNAEEEFRETFAKLHALIDASPLPILALSPDGTVTLWNPAAERVFGWTLDETLGKFLPFVPEDKLDEFCMLRERVMKGDGFSGVEITRRKKDGSPIEISLSTAPLRDNRGSITGIMAVVEDITGRKQAKEQLFESRQMLQLVLDNIPQRIFWKDRNLTYLGCNRPFAEDSGLTVPASLVGKTDFEMSWRETAGLYRADDAQVMETGEPKLNYEEPQNRPDGSMLWLRTSKVPLHDADGRVKGVLGMYEDITERKQIESALKSSEEQLRQSQKMEAIGRLAGGVAHDFNNLLTAIRGYSDLLLLRLDANSPTRREVEEIHKAAERAASLTQQLLAFSRKQVLQPKSMDLNAVVSGMDKMLRRLIGEDIDLVTILTPDLWNVLVDPSQVEQVIMNLLVNARDAMPKGGKVTIETANVELDHPYARRHPVVKPGEYVLLAVSDTGTGMDEETQIHLFEPFYTTKERGKGTGLGLSTVYGIVKQSSGYVWAYSEVGKGTAFKVYFPRYGDKASKAKDLASSNASLRGGETVLLVEDDEGVRSFVLQLLTMNGYRVLTAGNGDEALETAGRHRGPVHLLLTDVVMPKMGGRELAKSLEGRLPGIKAMYMSGYTDDAIVRHGVLDPGIPFLQKPFTPERLLRKVREVLAGDAGRLDRGLP